MGRNKGAAKCKERQRSAKAKAKNQKTDDEDLGKLIHGLDAVALLEDEDPEERALEFAMGTCCCIHTSGIDHARGCRGLRGSR